MGGEGLGDNDLGGDDLFPSAVGTPLDEFEPDPDLDDI
jgi:hypothetical protein